MSGKEYKDKKGKVWIKYSDNSGEKNLEQKVVKVEEWLKNNGHLKSDSGTSTNIDSNKNSGADTDDLNEGSDKKIEAPKFHLKIDLKNNKKPFLNNYHSQHNKPLIDQLKKRREEVHGIINKIDNYLNKKSDKTIIGSQNIGIVNAPVVKDFVPKFSKNNAGKKDAPLIVQFNEQKKNVRRLIDEIDNYSKYSINNKCGARDLNLNKKSDETIISQKSKNVFTEVFDKGRFKGIPLIGAFLRPDEESENQSYQKNECDKKKPDKAIGVLDLMQSKCESSCNINNALPKIFNKGEGQVITTIRHSFVEPEPKNQCYQPRIQKLLNNDLGKFKS